LVAGRGVDVEVARVNESVVLVVSTVEVTEGHVVNEAIADIRSSPGLETRCMLAVQHPEVLNDNVLDERHLALVLAKRSNGLTVSTIAVHSVNMNISGVALGRKAIITDVNPSALNLDMLDVERVEKVSVLGKRSSVVRDSSANNVLERNILG
jgi:hypothetical protein